MDCEPLFVRRTPCTCSATDHHCPACRAWALRHVVSDAEALGMAEGEHPSAQMLLRLKAIHQLREALTKKHRTKRRLQATFVRGKGTLALRLELDAVLQEIHALKLRQLAYQPNKRGLPRERDDADRPDAVAHESTPRASARDRRAARLVRATARASP